MLNEFEKEIIVPYLLDRYRTDQERRVKQLKAGPRINRKRKPVDAYDAHKVAARILKLKPAKVIHK